MDKGRFIVENDILTIETYEMAEQDFSKASTTPFDTLSYTAEEFHGTTPDQFHFLVLDAWSESILGTGEMIADGREGLNSTMLANAMQLSTFIGQTVELPIDDELYYHELMKRVATSRQKSNVREVVADTSNTFGSAK